MADGTVKIELDVDSSKAKANAKKEALDTGQQVGKNISSGVEDAAASTGTKAGAAIKSGVTSGSSGAGADAGDAISQGVKSGTSGAGDAAGSQIRTGVLSKLSGISDDLGSIGSAMSLAITAPLLAIGTASFTTSMNFDTAMSKLAGALNEPIDQIDSLRQLAIQTGQDTIYSASDAGSAMIELAKGGLTDAQIEGGALASTMQLASAGNLQLSDSANTVVRAMGAFHLSASDTESAVNALSGAANASSADVSDISMALSQASAQAYSAGWSIQDTTAAIAELADSGIKGSDAGTSLKTMLQSLQAPTDTAAKAIEELGLNVRDSNGNMLPAAQVIQQLQDKLGTLSSAQRDAALQTIFGSDASRAALVLMSGGVGTYSKYTEATNDQTAAQRMADAQMGSSQKAIENAKGAIETAAISLGGALSPAVEHAADVVGDAADKFAQLDEGQQKLVIGAAATAAAAGPVLSAGSKAIEVAGKVGKGFETLSVKMAEHKIASMESAGASTASAAASDADSAAKTAESVATKAVGDEAAGASPKLDTMTESSDKAAASHSGAASKAAGFAKAAAEIGVAAYVSSEATRTLMSSNADSEGRFDAASTAAEKYAKSLTTVDSNGDGVVDASDSVKTALDGSKNAFDRGGISMDGFAKKMRTVQDDTKGVAAAANDYFGRTEDDVSSAMQSIEGAVTNGWGAAVAATQVSGGTLSDETKTQALTMADAMKHVPEKYRSYADEAMRDMAATMAPYWPELADYTNMNATQIADIIEKKLTGVSTDSGQALELTGATTIDQLSQGITAAANGTKLDEATTATVESLLDSFSSSNLPDGMQDAGTESMQKLADGLKSQWPELANASSMSGDEIIAAMRARMDGTYDQGSAAAQGWASGLSSQAQAAVRSAEAVTGMSLDEFVSAAMQAGVEGDDAVTQYADEMAANAQAAKDAAMQVTDGAQGEFDQQATDAGNSGNDAVSDYASNMAAGTAMSAVSAQSNADAASWGLGNVDGSGIGGGIGGGYADGLWQQRGNAGDSGSQVSNAASDGLTQYNGDSWWWGNDLGSNLANGLSSARDAVAGAAQTLADDIWSFLHQSTAEVGPLSTTDEWGGDLAQNIITGMASMDGALSAQSAKSAAIISSGFDPLSNLGFTVSGSAAVNYSMMYNQSMADNGTYAALNNLGAKFDRLMDSLPTTIKDNAGLSGRDFARAVSGVIR